MKTKTIVGILLFIAVISMGCVEETSDPVITDLDIDINKSDSGYLLITHETNSQIFDNECDNFIREDNDFMIIDSAKCSREEWNMFKDELKKDSESYDGQFPEAPNVIKKYADVIFVDNDKVIFQSLEIVMGSEDCSKVKTTIECTYNE